MYIAQDNLLTIRRMVFDDLPFLVDVRNGCLDSLHNNKKFGLQDCIDWWKRDDPLFYLIEYNGHPVGYIRTSNWDRAAMHVYVGMDIHPDHRRRGYALASYKLLLDYLFSVQNMHKIALEVLSTNIPAISLYDKVGFKRDGVKRAELLRDGQWIDSVIMSILRSEWNYAS